MKNIFEMLWPPNYPNMEGSILITLVVIGGIKVLVGVVGELTEGSKGSEANPENSFGYKIKPMSASSFENRNNPPKK